ncbi:MAG: hypothetical protein HY056_05605 [Proteobacteria bacterium]|nr:hypothetical protein [Pseudomonadota bacterium]
MARAQPCVTAQRILNLARERIFRRQPVFGYESSPADRQRQRRDEIIGRGRREHVAAAMKMQRHGAGATAIEPAPADRRIPDRGNAHALERGHAEGERVDHDACARHASAIAGQIKRPPALPAKKIRRNFQREGPARPARP